MLQQFWRIGLTGILGKPTVGEAIYTCAGESCSLSRGRIPEDPVKIRAGEGTAGRDGIVLCGLLFDGEAQVWKGAAQV